MRIFALFLLMISPLPALAQLALPPGYVEAERSNSDGIESVFYYTNLGQFDEGEITVLRDASFFIPAIEADQFVNELMAGACPGANSIVPDRSVPALYDLSCPAEQAYGELRLFFDAGMYCHVTVGWPASSPETIRNELRIWMRGLNACPMSAFSQGK